MGPCAAGIRPLADFRLMSIFLGGRIEQFTAFKGPYSFTFWGMLDPIAYRTWIDAGEACVCIQE